MQACIELAILDHNYNTTTSGQFHHFDNYLPITLGRTRLKITFLERKMAWVAKSIIEDKQYALLTRMLDDIIPTSYKYKMDFVFITLPQ